MSGEMGCRLRPTEGSRTGCRWSVAHSKCWVSSVYAVMHRVRSCLGREAAHHGMRCTSCHRALPVLPEPGTYALCAQAESADAMQRFRAHSSRLMGDAKEQGDIEFGGEVLLESKVRLKCC